ncbi:serine protease [Pseudomonas sp. PDM31]|uniref:S1 family peptidase n=1 Tax=Pseudomonas sp. PDM31 TaxID=2854778 RepID=UPI001C460E8C|nr:serine protease [Pseudomonas sp. PDM31]MBV7477918.1 serine protease [Pseudomonas sp. PDM31]
MTYKMEALGICVFFALTTPAITYANDAFSTPSSILLKNSDNHYSRLNGVGVLHYSDSPYCTASLLDTRDKSGNAAGPAYLLTAEHCSNPWDDLSQLSVKFNYFSDTYKNQKNYKINKVTWSRHSIRDLAILELAVPLDSLLKEGITPLKISDDASSLAGNILIVGAPSGLDGVGLRLARCTQQTTDATLVEADEVYPETRKNNCIDIRGGSSGSPVIDTETGEIAGVLFTSTHGATLEKMCSRNNPCEVRDAKPFLAEETQYSVPVDSLSACFVDGRFDLKSSDCQLSSTTDFRIKNAYLPEKFRTPSHPDNLVPKWNIRFSMDAPFYRLKTVQDAKSCYSPHYYSGTISTVDAVIDTSIGSESGMYFLCLLGVQSAGHRPDARLFNSIQIIPARLVETNFKPLPQPALTLTPSPDFPELYVDWHEKSPYPFWVHYFDDDIGERKCADLNPGEFTRQQIGLVVPMDALPITLCSYIQDEDLNTSEVRTDVVRAPEIITVDK